MPEDLKSFITGIGAMCEMSAILRDSLMQNGFTREEACHMVSNILVACIQPGKEHNQ